MTYWTSGQTITASGLNYLKITTPTSSYTILNTDDIIKIQCSNTCTLTLPSAVGLAGKSFFIRKHDTTSNHITIKCNGTELIEGTSSYDLRTIYGMLHIKSDNVGYYEVGTLEHYGMIKMWSGSESDIPRGWVLCNGSNGTRDLRSRFIVGAGDTYAVGDTGGATTHTLTTDEMPAHTHTIGQNILTGSANSFEEKGQTATGSITSDSTGGGGAHENLPPYYALCYIMRL